GITNVSGTAQRFLTAKSPGNGGEFEFANSATAGVQTVFMLNGAMLLPPLHRPGEVTFSDTSTAGSAAFILDGGAGGGALGGKVSFYGTSAENGVFLIKGGVVNLAEGGLVDFNSATAGNAVINSSGGTVSGAHGGETLFEFGATAENARI